MNRASLPACLRRFVTAAHRIAAHGLLACSSGNLSWRCFPDRLVITGTGTWLGTLSVRDVAVCRLRDGALLRGCRPSKELGFHAGILRLRPDVRVVLHYQSPWATVLACTRPHHGNFFVTPEIPYYVGPVATVPYRHPGTAALAAAVVRALRGHDLVILRNHGQVVVGTDFADALQKAVFFEQACRIVLLAGRALRTIPEAGIRKLLTERAAARKGGGV